MSGFRDRAEAGAVLAGLVAARMGGPVAALPGGGRRPRPLVLGIPRGGVVVAAPVAAAIDGDLAPITAVKIRAPHHPELAIGAVAPDGIPLVDRDLVDRLGLDAGVVAAQTAAAHAEVIRRQAVFGAVPAVTGRVTVIVDDGVATGATLRAALGHVRRAGPERLVCALPVGPPEVLDRLAAEVDDLVCPLRPRWFSAVGEFYGDFPQVDDGEVLALL